MKIRKMFPGDVNDVLLLIRGLAEYEKAPNEVINTPELMLKHMEEKLFHAFVAEESESIVGMAICYFRYSTWKGKCLYLEDLYVLEDYRGKGVGLALFNKCKEYGLEENCVRMNWQVLDWNQPAIDFYKGSGTYFDPEWINCSIDLSV
ncbi:GNAT family N-acetyltransferase [bacterium]|nr:GNAT family N-acetyltransferase [bacterium]